MSTIFDKTTKALSSSLSLRQLRNDIISSNVANAETPNYHSKKVDFEDALQRALDIDGIGKMSVSHSQHFGLGQGGFANLRADVYENPEAAINNDGNTVDLEKEMAILGENAVLYKATLQLINKKLAALRYAISEGAKE